jgi:hypothetical protein
MIYSFEFSNNKNMSIFIQLYSPAVFERNMNFSKITDSIDIQDTLECRFAD